MTLPSEVSRWKYPGNGSTTQFDYTNKILDQDDLKVYVVASGVATLKTITTHYTVSGVGVAGGGKVTMLTAPASGESLLIVREPAFTQTTSIRNQGAFLPSLHEDAFDNQTAQSQSLKDQVGRAIKAPIQEGPADFDMTLPIAVTRANKALAFDEDGLPTTLTLADGSLASNAASHTFDPSGSGATARTVQAKLRERVSVKDFGAVGDGSTDDTAAIQAALDSSSSRVFIPAGTYIVSASLRIPSNTCVFGEGVASRMLLAPESDTNLVTNSDWGNDASTYGNENIIIEKLFLDGNRTNNSPEAGVVSPKQGLIDLVNVKNAVIADIRGVSPVIHGINLTSRDEYATNAADKGPGCTNVIIERCIISDCGDDGITTHDSQNVTIDSCIVFDAAGTWTSNTNGIEIDDGSSDTVVSNCIVYNCGDGIEVKGHDARLPHNGTTTPPSNVSITNCFVSDCDRAFDIGHRGNPTQSAGVCITGCVSEGCNYFARIAHYKDVSISGCTGRYSGGASGAFAVVITASEADESEGCENVTISNNTFEGWTNTTFAAITSGKSSKNISITGNSIIGAGRGIWVGDDSHGVTVTGNTIKDFGSSGILVAPASGYSATNIIVSNNVVRDNSSGYGIRINGEMENVSVTGNVISGITTPGGTGSRGAIAVTNELGNITNLSICNNTLVNPEARAGIYLHGDDGSSNEIKGAIISGNYVRGHMRYGIILLKVSYASITGNYLLQNGMETNDTYSQILVTTTSDGNNIQGNKIVRRLVGDTGNRPKYGIEIASGCSDNLVTNNDLLNSGVTGALLNNGTGTITTAGNRS